MKLVQTPKKSLGQNFLIDKNIIDKIIKIENINKNKMIVEIGAGYGNLTAAISTLKPKKIFAIEKDKKLFSFLDNKFENHKNIKIINEDILNIDLNKFTDYNKIVGNLPYYITTPIIFKVLEYPFWDKIVFMVQKEVAARLTGKVCTKEYGLCRLAIICFVASCNKFPDD